MVKNADISLPCLIIVLLCLVWGIFGKSQVLVAGAQGVFFFSGSLFLPHLLNGRSHMSLNNLERDIKTELKKKTNNKK